MQLFDNNKIHIYIQAANGTVRHNAAAVLLNVFPLQDPDMVAEAREELMTRQLSELERLLHDSLPDVRTVAAQGNVYLYTFLLSFFLNLYLPTNELIVGVLHILSTFWEIIPSSAISRLMHILVNDLLND